MRKIKDIVLLKDKDMNAFPTLTQAADGTLLAGFRKARHPGSISGRAWDSALHLDPASKIVMISSSDGGEHWGDIRTLHDHFLYGAQDPSFTTLPDGTILASFFQWYIFEGRYNPFPAEITYGVDGKYAARIEGCYTMRSSDHGRTWDVPVRVEYPEMRSDISVRGQALAADDGSVLMAVNEFFHTTYLPRRAVLLQSFDGGKTWKQKSVIAESPQFRFGETQLFRTKSGGIVAFLRAHSIHTTAGNAFQDAFLFTARSDDGGASFAPCIQTTVTTPSPFFPLGLRSGNVLLSYGYRHAPYGIRGRVIDAECQSIDEAEEFEICGGMSGFDIGYTWAVQRHDGTVLVIYYTYGKDQYRHIAGSILSE